MVRAFNGAAGESDAAHPRQPRVVAAPDRRLPLFIFFSNRLGCTTSLLVTILGTLLILWLMNVISF
jgi:hypothetical protein